MYSAIAYYKGVIATVLLCMMLISLCLNRFGSLCGQALPTAMERNPQDYAWMIRHPISPVARWTSEMPSRPVGLAGTTSPRTLFLSIVAIQLLREGQTPARGSAPLSGWIVYLKFFKTR